MRGTTTNGLMPVAKPEPRYDVFISYRRGAADELALLLKTRLQQHGLMVFTDHDLKRGFFDEILLRRIAETPTFLVILTPNALDRCTNEQDWLRKEIVQAVSKKQNIIPLLVDSFKFTPEVVAKLDPSVQELARYQAVEYSRTYFESTIEHIARIVRDDQVERGKQTSFLNRGVVRNALHRMREPLPLAGVMMVLAVLLTGGLWLFSFFKPITKEPLPPTNKSEKTTTSGPTETPKKEERKLPVGKAGTSASPASVHQTTHIATSTVKINPKDGLNYVWISAGTFQMGCSIGDNQCYPDEKPAHSVTFTRGFWLGQTLVTQAAYQRVMNSNPSHFRGEKLPVESLRWSQADSYCKAAGGHLPTEAQWEYAARAGSTAPRYGELDAIGWYFKNGGEKTHDVEQERKQPNRWKLYDMLGNVCEWVGDWYKDDYYKESPAEDPLGPLSRPKGQEQGEEQKRVHRGGGWTSDPVYLRASARQKARPDFQNYALGFRCALDSLP